MHLAEHNDPFGHTWPIGRRLSMADLEHCGSFASYLLRGKFSTIKMRPLVCSAGKTNLSLLGKILGKMIALITELEESGTQFVLLLGYQMWVVSQAILNYLYNNQLLNR